MPSRRNAPPLPRRGRASRPAPRGVLAEQRRRFDFGRHAVEAHRPGRHRHLALAVRHLLQDAALVEARFVDQLLRVEHRAGRDADRAELRHRLVLGALPGPGGDDLVNFRLVLQAGVRRVIARIADQILAPDQLQEARPMLRIGAAGQQVDVIVGAAGLARVDAARRVVGGRPARRGLAGAGLRDESAAAVMHDRILHRHLQPRPLPVRARSNSALTMLNAISMPVPVSPIVGPGLIGRPPRSPVMLIAPPAACAIGSNDSPFSYGLPAPKPFTWA